MKKETSLHTSSLISLVARLFAEREDSSLLADSIRAKCGPRDDLI